MKSLPDIVLDDVDAQITGAWTRSARFKPSIGSGYLVTGAEDASNYGKATATFRVKVPKSGQNTLHFAYSQLIKRRCKELGIPVTAVYAGDQQGWSKTQSAVVEFLLRHVGLPAPGGN